MYVCIHIYIHIYAYKYMYTYTHTCTYIQTHMALKSNQRMNALHCPRMSVFSFKYTEATCLVSCLHAFTTPEPGHQQVLTDIVELQSDEDIRHLIAPIPHSAEHPEQKPFVLASHGWQPPPPSLVLRDPSCQLTALYCCSLLLLLLPPCCS